MESIDPLAPYSYRFGGLVVDSIVPIGLLPVADQESAVPTSPRIIVKTSDQPIVPEGEFVYTWTGRQDLLLYKIPAAWVFRYSSGIEFRIDHDGSTITCFPGPSGWSSEVTEMLVRRILPRVIVLQNRHVIHGASLTTPFGGILLCGPSRAGKSTLAASLSQNFGWGLLDDDTSIMTEHAPKGGSTSFILHSAALRASLWQDSLEALSENIIHSEEMAVTDGKYRCELPNTVAVEDQELAAIYLVDSYASGNALTDEVTLDTLSPQDATALLVRHQVRFYPSDAEAEMQRLTSFSKMVRNVWTRALRYPRSYDRLQEVCNLIREDMTTSTHACK